MKVMVTVTVMAMVLLLMMMVAMMMRRMMRMTRMIMMMRMMRVMKMTRMMMMKMVMMRGSYPSADNLDQLEVQCTIFSVFPFERLAYLHDLVSHMPQRLSVWFLVGNRE